MPTSIELKFNSIVKNIYYAKLKPLGYKKKGNNFYLEGDNIGKLISVQKSSLYSKDYIKFTVNIGLFSARLWDAYYSYPDKKLPGYPSIGQCSIRRRIGSLANLNDSWCEISEVTDTNQLQSSQYLLLTEFVLPYLNGINTDEDIFAASSDCLPHEVYIKSPTTVVL